MDRELKSVDPRTLQPNPHNPRRTPAGPQADAMLAASIKEDGILQPPLVSSRTEPMTILIGHRRTQQAVVAGLESILVIVVDIDPADAAAIAVLENTHRTNLNPVDLWRAIERLTSGQETGTPFTEEGIASRFAMPVREVQKLRLLGKVHAKMLDRIAAGDQPDSGDLRVIASAPSDEQADAWKRLKPKKGETVAWKAIAQALKKVRLPASAARFDDALAAAYGVTWETDLFAPANQDGRSTTNIEGFLGAQDEWLRKTLPENTVVLTLAADGSPVLPRHATATFRDGADVKKGRYVNPQTGQVEELGYIVHEPAAPKAPASASTSKTAATTPSTPDAASTRTRPEISAKGVAMIGLMRTDALHMAVQRAPLDDAALIGLLILALGADNVAVTGPEANGKDRIKAAARRIAMGNVLCTDLEALRAAARDVIAASLSCKDDVTNSGPGARIAAIVTGACDHLPTMATAEFLGTLSKSALEAVARMNRVTVAPTAKETRARMVSKFEGAVFVHPEALFTFSKAELTAMGRNRGEPARGVSEPPAPPASSAALKVAAGTPDPGGAGEPEAPESEEGALPTVATPPDEMAAAA